MTLVAPRKRSVHHKKLSGKHHRHDKAYHKAYWPYLPMIAVLIAGFFINNSSAIPGHRAVLGYATDMSISGLLSGTNTQRLNNGESALALNGLLDNAAQSKANDMAARDYWSHNTPDGQTPWTFITAAGYSYSLAGENLAYGFATSADTITGWMNSPGHRANILNAGYTEVGFGIVNIPNYQGTGPETLVVAMYAAPAAQPAPAPAPTPAPTAKAATPSSGSPSTPSSSDVAADNSQPTTADPTTQSTPAAEGTPVNSPDTVTPTSSPLKDVPETKQERISRGQILTAGSAPWSELVLSLLGLAGVMIVFLRHGLAWHRLLRRGEQFVLHHPWTDTAIVAGIVAVAILIGSAGVIK
jgi:uncharacterized protein YkwD